MSIEITVLGAAKVQARATKLAELPQTMGPFMLGMATKLAGHIAKSKLAGQVLNKRTGRLSRSIFPAVYMDGPNTITGVAATNVEYARIHEYGGVIRPVNKKWLTIPLKAALTPAGVMRYPSAPQYPNTFLAKGTIFQKGKGNGAAPVPLFLLRKTSNIPARPFMAPSLREMKGEIIQAIQDRISRAMQ